MGDVIEVGDVVVKVKVGEMVSLIGCGFCANCERGLTGFCLTVNPGMAGGAYGYPSMGGYQGGQAELLRVPFGEAAPAGTHVHQRRAPRAARGSGERAGLRRQR